VTDEPVLRGLRSTSNEELLGRLARELGERGALRVDCDPDTVEHGLAKLVLTLIELLRGLLERQAIRRMEGGSLSDAEIEALGQALMRLEAKIHELAGAFGLSPDELKLDLGGLTTLLK